MFNEHSCMQSFPMLSLSSAISTTAGEGTSICCLKPSWIPTHHICAAFRIPSVCLAANVNAFHHCWIGNSFSSPAGRPRPYSPFQYTISRDPTLLSFGFHCHAKAFLTFVFWFSPQHCPFSVLHFQCQLSTAECRHMRLHPTEAPHIASAYHKGRLATCLQMRWRTVDLVFWFQSSQISRTCSRIFLDIWECLKFHPSVCGCVCYNQIAT